MSNTNLRLEGTNGTMAQGRVQAWIMSILMTVTMVTEYAMQYIDDKYLYPSLFYRPFPPLHLPSGCDPRRVICISSRMTRFL